MQNQSNSLITFDTIEKRSNNDTDNNNSNNNNNNNNNKSTGYGSLL